MRESTGVSNHMSGTAEGSTVQAGVVYGGVLIAAPTRVSQVVREVRALRFTAVVYRFLASVVGCAAAHAIWSGDTPLSTLGLWCNALTAPSAWTSAVAAWTADRGEGLGLAATAMVTLGLVAMPAPQLLGGDLGAILHWRGPSTTVLGLALAVQCGILLQLVAQILLCAAVVLWFIGRFGIQGVSRSDRVTVAVMGVLLALVFAPIVLFAWGYGRDRTTRPHLPGAM